MTTGSMTHVQSGSVNPYSNVQPTSLRVHGVCIELPRDNVWDAMTPDSCGLELFDAMPDSSLLMRKRRM